MEWHYDNKRFWHIYAQLTTVLLLSVLLIVIQSYSIFSEPGVL